MKTTIQKNLLRINRSLSYALVAILFLATLTNCSKDDAPAPTPEAAIISSISPQSGPKATLVTINGSHFGDNIDQVSVYFNQVEALVQSVTDTKITATMPARAYTGLVKVRINGTELIGPEFEYLISEFQVSTLAGSTAGDTNGTGEAAQFNRPRGVSTDSQGNIYVADSDNHKIKKITPNGVVTTFAGSTQGDADGTGTDAQFNIPRGLAMDNQDNLYIADSNNHKIRKITPNGVVTTLAGSVSGFEDETGENAKFNLPYALVIDGQNNLYIADHFNHKIRKITPNGVVTTLAGSAQGDSDGMGANAQFWGPSGIELDSQNNLYVADHFNHKIRKITPSGVVTTFAGSTTGFEDELGENAKFKTPFGIAIDPQNNLYVSDYGNNKIRKITPNSMVITVAGSTSGFANGSGTDAQFNGPTGITLDNQGNIYIAGFSSHKIRKITLD